MEYPPASSTAGRKPLDPRTIRTVEAIEHALRRLLAEVPLDKVTVTLLCDAAGVKRQSFYTHFDSVSGLAAQILTAEIDEVLVIPDVGNVPAAHIEPMIVANLAHALRLMARDRLLYRAVLTSQSSAAFHQTLERAIRTRVINVIRIWQGIGYAGTIDLDVAVPFATGGIVRAIEAWVEHDAGDADVWARAIRDQMPDWWPKPGRPH